MWEKGFQTSGKKSGVLRKKFHQGWQNCILFNPKDWSRKKSFCWKKSISLNLLELSRKFRMNVFSSFVGRPSQFFGRKIEEVSLWKKFLSFCFSTKQFWDLRRSTFCSAVKTSFEISGWLSWRFFSKKRTLQCLFSDIQPEISGSVGKLQALLSKNLVAFPEKHLELEIFLDKKFLFWTFSKGKILDLWSTLFESSVGTAHSYPFENCGKKLTEKVNDH